MTEKVDKITLTDALDMPLWKMVWAGEPNRAIDVRMTYTDLMVICKMLEDKDD